MPNSDDPALSLPNLTLPRFFQPTLHTFSPTAPPSFQSGPDGEKAAELSAFPCSPPSLFFSGFSHPSSSLSFPSLF